MTDEWLPITLVEVDVLLQSRYPGLIGTYQLQRDECHFMVGSLTTLENATHRLHVKNVVGIGLYYQEVLLKPIESEIQAI